MEPPLNQTHLVSFLHWFSQESNLIFILKMFQLPPAHSLSASFAICLATCSLPLESGFGGSVLSSIPSPALGKTVFVSPGVSCLMTRFSSQDAAVECVRKPIQRMRRDFSLLTKSKWIFPEPYNGGWGWGREPIIRHTNLPCSRSTMDVFPPD